MNPARRSGGPKGATPCPCVIYSRRRPPPANRSRSMIRPSPPRSWARSSPVLVDFWAPWCAPCRLVGGLLEEIGPDYHGRLRIVKLNVDESPQTAGRFGISSIPTMILFKDGKAVDHIVGAMPMQPLRQWLDRHAPRIERRWTRDPDLRRPPERICSRSLSSELAAGQGRPDPDRRLHLRRPPAGTGSGGASTMKIRQIDVDGVASRDSARCRAHPAGSINGATHRSRSHATRSGPIPCPPCRKAFLVLLTSPQVTLRPSESARNGGGWSRRTVTIDSRTRRWRRRVARADRGQAGDSRAREEIVLPVPEDGLQPRPPTDPRRR